MPNLELIPPRVVRGLGVRPVPSELWRGRLSWFGLLLGGLVFVAYQSVTPVRASPKTAVN